jgi:hypothetical protein
LARLSSRKTTAFSAVFRVVPALARWQAIQARQHGNTYELLFTLSEQQQLKSVSPNDPSCAAGFA